MAISPIEVKVKWTRNRKWTSVIPDNIEFRENGYKLTMDYAAIRAHVNAKHNIEWLVVENGREYECSTKAIDVNGIEANVWIEFKYANSRSA